MQACPAGQVPQLSPQPSSPHFFVPQLGVHAVVHCLRRSTLGRSHTSCRNRCRRTPCPCTTPHTSAHTACRPPNRRHRPSRRHTGRRNHPSRRPCRGNPACRSARHLRHRYRPVGLRHHGLCVVSRRGAAARQEQKDKAYQHPQHGVMIHRRKQPHEAPCFPRRRGAETLASMGLGPRVRSPLP